MELEARPHIDHGEIEEVITIGVSVITQRLLDHYQYRIPMFRPEYDEGDIR